MMRYLRIWVQFLKMSWMADMEYRVNYLVRVCGEVIWYISQLSVFEVLYLHTATLNGWDVHAMRVFMGTLFVSDVLWMIFFNENMDNFMGLIRRGELDLYLVKPISSRFMVSCRKVNTAAFLNLIMVSGYLAWAVVNMPREIGGAQWAFYVVLVLSGVLISYTMRFLFNVLALVLHEAGNVQFIWYQLYRLATRPDILYPPYLRILIFTIFPVAFIASVPSRILVEGLSWKWLVAGVLASAVVMFLGSFCWSRALRRYSSASS
jgi:ABC-2 type transport system permease protein